MPKLIHLATRADGTPKSVEHDRYPKWATGVYSVETSGRKAACRLLSLWVQHKDMEFEDFVDMAKSDPMTAGKILQALARVKELPRG